MDTSEAIKIVEALANGIDPATGEILKSSTPFNNPTVIRALFHSLKALERFRDRERRYKNLPENAGKPWDAEEDNLLIHEFENAITVREIASRHKRTTGGIASRLVRLGNITHRSDILKQN